MGRSLLQALEENPVIAAVQDDEALRLALECRCRAVFVLYGDLMTLPGIVKRLHAAGKLVLVHMELVEGLSDMAVAVDSLNLMAGPDGIVSDIATQIRRARHLGLITVQRFLAIDSKALRALQAQLKVGKPDMVEVAPGLMPRVLGDVAAVTGAPLIAGGLIRSRQEVLAALDAGAVGVSTTERSIWDI